MKTQPSKNLSQRLVLYGLGAGAASVAASHADAAILYSGPVEYSGNMIHFDLQNAIPPSSSFMAQDDFKLNSKPDKGKAKILTEGSYSPGWVGLMQPGGPYIDRLLAGTTIGNSSNFYNGIGFFNGPDQNGEWLPGERGFAGLRLTINGNNYFGWADITLNNLTGDGLPVFTLHSYAINLQPNQSINAGQKKKRRNEVVSPLLLLLAGASGVTALKRRRKKSSI